MTMCTRGRENSKTGGFAFQEQRSLPVQCCVMLLRGYKRFVSPLLPPSCRFTPTCSEYAIEALRSRGLAMGMVLAAYRLLRCHPFSRGGYDPVD